MDGAELNEYTFEIRRIEYQGNDVPKELKGSLSRVIKLAIRCKKSKWGKESSL